MVKVVTQFTDFDLERAKRQAVLLVESCGLTPERIRQRYRECCPDYDPLTETELDRLAKRTRKLHPKWWHGDERQA